MDNSSKTPTDLKRKICAEIGRLYVFHGYAVSPDNKTDLEAQKQTIIELADLMLTAQPDLTEKEAMEFFLKVKLGEFGVLYRAPSSLMSMFQLYRGHLVRQKILGNIE